MVHKPSEYWANFGRFKDKTEQVRTFKGPSSTEQTGAKYDFHDGDAVGEQKGNKSTIQTGWSNSYLRGFSFSTTLGQSTSTTVGNSFSNHTGFKWGMFVGPETSINAATSVKVAKGAAFSFDTVTKCETTAQKAESSLKKTEIATALTRTIGQEISTLTGFTQVVGGKWSASSGDYNVQALSAISLWSGAKMKLNSTLVAIESKTWLQLNATARVTMTSDGPATINGAIIRVG
jgi:hypothetical protein